ncbi:hypothetical protein FUAX_02960 [Fulvitalea axinellae]|uniref:Uncharacterized protein n=1 Tax=Fulvitalea axinellae TaxID=1182444 RepID=A0AAU9D0C4_9BACT|nr:hypothetical protein FUAX_02960 [Fulvitalea axinellae]
MKKSANAQSLMIFAGNISVLEEEKVTGQIVFGLRKDAVVIQMNSAGGFGLANKSGDNRRI